MFTLLLIICANISFGQTLYNPQVLYDNPTGLYDTDSLRSIDINFYNPKYDSILQDGWTTSSGLRLPATVLLSNGIYLDSVAIRYKGNSTYSVPQSFNNPKLPLNLDNNALQVVDLTNPLLTTLSIKNNLLYILAVPNLSLIHI